MINRAFGTWPPPLPGPHLPPIDDPMGFQNPRPVFSGAGGAMPARAGWKGKKAADKWNKAPAGAAAAGYKPPALNELQFQNRLKTRRFFPKKKPARFAPFAPRNTTSYLIRAKKAGGIASLVSPCPVTPAILPTPKFSPSREVLVDMAKEEWGVDGYGSMKGLIRLRSPSGFEIRPGGGGGGGGGDDEEEVEEGSSESDVEEHLEVERRLDHDLSRFEMLYPGGGGEEQAAAAAYLLENRVDDQDSHIAQLEEENLTLKERLFLMEREMDDLRRRMQVLEAHCRERDSNVNAAIVNAVNGNEDDNREENSNNANAAEDGGGGDVCSERSADDCAESPAAALMTE